MKKKILITFLLCIVCVAPYLSTVDYLVIKPFDQHGEA